MGVPHVISWFDDFGTPDNEWRFLSNFYVGPPIHFAKYVALTGEHLFQAMKARDGYHFRKILAAATPGEAKAEGRHLLGLRPDWERVKLDVMRVVLAHKFTLDREEGRRLLDTENALLVEGTHWGDQVWGVALDKGESEPGASWQAAPGRNWLGVLLMARRAELYAELAGFPTNYATSIDFIRYRPATEDV
jgi:ribA/ribD-fused uncharacterized protein